MGMEINHIAEKNMRAFLSAEAAAQRTEKNGVTAFEIMKLAQKAQNEALNAAAIVEHNDTVKFGTYRTPQKPAPTSPIDTFPQKKADRIDNICLEFHTPIETGIIGKTSGRAEGQGFTISALADRRAGAYVAACEREQLRRKTA